MLGKPTLKSVNSVRFVKAKKQIRPTRFSKVPKLFGSTSGNIRRYPHVAYSNRICLSTRIRIHSWYSGLLKETKVTEHAQSMRIDFTVRNRARSCYVVRLKKIPDLASTRFRIHSGLQSIHSGERTQKVPDSPANSPDTCGRKA